MRVLSKWPVPALAVWLAAWAGHRVLLGQGVAVWAALLWPCMGGALAAAVAARAGQSRARQAALVAGFPVCWTLLWGVAVPAWAWWGPLALLVWVYPMRNWADAPVFPTPLNALADVPRHAPLPWGARVLDAGCGVGDGLLALRQAYPDVQLEGLEFSRPLSWLARWRCSWAVIHHADMWQTDWGAYQLVYLFQRPETMARAVHKARQELAPGAWLVSLEFAAPELKPQASVSLDGGRSVWLYQAPFEQA